MWIVLKQDFLLDLEELRFLLQMGMTQEKEKSVFNIMPLLLFRNNFLTNA